MKHARKKIHGQAGYMLLSIMLLVTVMLLALSVELPRIAQQIKREKEEELYHRGMDHAMAIKRFVHKMGRYPASLEQLEDTNHIRFLRKRYKDPMTPEGEWRLVHVGEAQINFTAQAGTNPGPQGSNNTSVQGSGGSNGSNGFPPPGVTPNGQSGLNSSGQSGFNQSGFNQPGGTQQGNTGQLGSLTVQNIGNGQPTGGGPIMGVASTSKATSIKEFNDQNTYDGWLFVYDPNLERNGGPGIIVAAPRGTTTSSGNASGPQGPTGPATNPVPGPNPGGTPVPGPQVPQ